MGRRVARRFVTPGLVVLALATGLGDAAAGGTAGAFASANAAGARSSATAAGETAGLGVIAGRGGCIVGDPVFARPPVPGCGRAEGERFDGATFSPDGRFLYVPRSSPDGLRVFRRDRASGALRRLRGRANCASPTGSGGRCIRVPGLIRPGSVAVSPDGRNVYVSGGSEGLGSVVSLRRDRRTGALRAIRGRRGCVSVDGSGGLCSRVALLEGPGGVQAEPGTRTAHLVVERARILTLTRAARDGALVPRRGRRSCLSVTDDGGSCLADHRLQGLRDLVLHPRRSRWAYAIAGEVGARSGAILVLRSSSGLLSPVSGRRGCLATGRSGCRRVSGLRAPVAAVATPDGRHLYVTTDDPASLVTALRVHGGRLRRVGCAGLGRTCTYTTPYGQDPLPAVSADGRFVYVAGGGERMELYRRDPATGRLARLDCLLVERFVWTGQEDRCGAAWRGFAPVRALAPASDSGIYAAGYNGIAALGHGVRVLGGSARATAAGYVRIRVHCPAPAGRLCTGTFQLRAERDPPSRFNDRTVEVGGGRFAIQGARRSVVHVPLTGGGRNRLLRRGEYLIQVRARARAGDDPIVEAGRALRLLPPAGARPAGRRPHSCARLGNVSVIARSGRTIVFRALEPAFDESSPDVPHTYACLGRSRRPVALDNHDDDWVGTTVTGPVAAAGERVAYALTVDEEEGSLEHRIVVEHIGRGTVERDVCTGAGVPDTGCQEDVVGIVVTRRGGVAWAFAERHGDDPVHVVKLDSGAAEPELLASGAGIRGGTLALRGSRVTWRDRRGRRHSAPIS